MKQLANEQGIDLDYTKVKPNEWNIACSMTCERHKTLRFEGQTIVLEETLPQDKQPLKNIFTQMAIEKPFSLEQVRQVFNNKLSTLSEADRQNVLIYEQDALKCLNSNRFSQEQKETFIIHFYQNIADKIQNGQSQLPPAVDLEKAKTVLQQNTQTTEQPNNETELDR